MSAQGALQKMTPEQISAGPGKSIDGRLHPALWHMLDVGAVAACLTVRRTLTASCKADRAASFLVALHDLGKFSASFRAMLLGRSYTGLRHWQHSYRLLRDHDGLLSDRLGATKGVRRILYAAVAGLHGGLPEHPDYRKSKDQANQIGDEASRIAGEAIQAVASLEGMTESEARGLSWALSGLTIQADWIGSNPEWFGSRDAGGSGGNRLAGRSRSGFHRRCDRCWQDRGCADPCLPHDGGRQGGWILFRPADDGEFATLDWVPRFNDQRLLGPIGDVAPAEFEQMYYQQQQSRLDEAGLN